MRRRAHDGHLDQVWSRLINDLPDYRKRLDEKLLDELYDRFSARANTRSGSKLQHIELIDFLREQISETANSIYEARRAHANFGRTLVHASSAAEEQEAILEYAQILGRSRRALAGDQKAFGRWFDKYAMDDRYRFKIAELERKIALYLDRLGWLSQQCLLESEDPLSSWQQLNLEEDLQPLLAYDGDSRVQVASFQALSQAIHSLPRPNRQDLLSDATLKYVYSTALNTRSKVWLQRKALTLLEALSSDAIVGALEKRLRNPQDGDDLFVRRKAINLAGRVLIQSPALETILVEAVDDPSAYVRQAIPEAIRSASKATVMLVLGRLLGEDTQASVRAAALLAITTLVDRKELFEDLLALLISAFDSEPDSFVMRTGFKTVVDTYDKLMQLGRSTDAEHWSHQLAILLGEKGESAVDLAVRRWAAETMETIWFRSSIEAQALAGQLRPLIAKTRNGASSRIPNHLIQESGEYLFGRTLSQLALRDHSLELERGLGSYRLRRGHKFGFRWWRFLYELRHPASDKRQAYRHTIGRIFRGLISAPSSILAEQSATKVPGEPLIIAEEHGWRPYLPLLDQTLSALDQGWPTRPLRIYSPQGITELTPPSSLIGRLWARARLSHNFSHFAHLRNWQDSTREAPDSYVRALENLGFRISFRPHPDKEGKVPPRDLSVARFFSATPLLILTAGDMWHRMQDYVFSVYENSLFHLAIFVSTATSIFLGRHVVLGHQLRRARRHIPLVMGGWGTRGKSGTERLKAALINAKGYATISKTSGCEAMFLIAPAFGELKEMFLFRPYEKATIWEQHNLVILARRLKSEVFLWECMGLSPSYVHILQHNWMNDDYSTITNTYPDHEDLQGPAGHNVAEVMTNFIPANSLLLTSEENMLPVLADAARQRHTKLKAVGWLEAGLITPDILARFPYAEHPYNIALVSELGKEMGINPDFALKEMADRIVPDLGVLKTFPIAQIDSRKLEFVMGMSANERFGTLENWRRTSFDKHSLERDPETWVSTVINNRADRTARSRVFASLIVNDVSADLHLLIGNNLTGLLGYIREAWEERVREAGLWPSGEASPLLALENLARKWRIPYSQNQLLGRINAMLAGQGSDYLVSATDLVSDDSLREAILKCAQPEATLRFWEKDLTAFGEFNLLKQQIMAGVDSESDIESALEQQLWRWLRGKLVMVDDYHAEGDTVIRQIVANSPPGLTNRIMGMQNIKGTGLDFVYRWQAWDQCHKACQKLQSSSPVVAKMALEELGRFMEFGILSEHLVRQSIATVSHLAWAQNEEVQASLNAVLHRQGDCANEGIANPESGWKVRLLGSIEAFLDAGDSVRRRKKANRIYKDLVDQRISQDRAALELQKLSNRQKGGWLYRDLNQNRA